MNKKPKAPHLTQTEAAARKAAKHKAARQRQARQARQALELVQVAKSNRIGV